MSTRDTVTAILDILACLVMKVRLFECVKLLVKIWCGFNSDIRECEIGNGGCEQICIDFIGGYNCSCEDGFRPQTMDESSCEGI